MPKPINKTYSHMTFQYFSYRTKTKSQITDNILSNLLSFDIF